MKNLFSLFLNKWRLWAFLFLSTPIMPPDRIGCENII